MRKWMPGGLTCASTGIGTQQHYACELLTLLTGGKFVHVPYKGGGPAINDLVGGQVQMMFSSHAVRPFVDAGKACALAVSYSERSRLFPSLPTVIEAGVPGFVIGEWYGVAGPAKLPSDIVNRLNEELVKILNSPEIVAKAATPGVEVKTTTPQAFGALIKSELERFKDIAKKANIKPE